MVGSGQQACNFTTSGRGSRRATYYLVGQGAAGVQAVTRPPPAAQHPPGYPTSITHLQAAGGGQGGRQPFKAVPRHQQRAQTQQVGALGQLPAQARGWVG